MVSIKQIVENVDLHSVDFLKEAFLDWLQKNPFHSWGYFIQYTKLVDKGQPNVIKPEELEPYKKDIMTCLLYDVKYAENLTHEKTQILLNIKTLKDIGIDWPELNTIQQSLNNNVVEDDTQSDGLEDAWQMLYDLFKKKMESSNRGIYFMLYDITEWGLNYEKFPRLRELIEPNKERLIKDMLVDIRSNNDVQAADQVLDRLLRIGVDWPELMVIKKSSDEDDDVNYESINEESANEKLMHIIDMIYSADSYHEVCLYAADVVDTGFTGVYKELQIPKFMAEHKQGIIHAVLQMIKSNAQHDPDPADVVKGLKILGADYPEFATIENSLQRGETQSVPESGNVNKRDYKLEQAEQNARLLGKHLAVASKYQIEQDDQYRAAFIDAIYMIIDHPIGYKELIIPILEHYKKTVIYMMLSMAKQGSTGYVHKALQALYGTHVNWPELQVIHDSLTHNNNLVKENTTSDDELSMGQEQLRRMAANHIFSALQNKSWNSLLDTAQTIQQNQWSLDSRYRFPEKLDQYKTDIIKTILKEVKNPRWFKGYLIPAVKGLKRIGVDWPELDMILNSLEHTINQANNMKESDQGRYYPKYDFAAMAIQKKHDKAELYVKHIVDDLQEHDWDMAMDELETYVNQFEHHGYPNLFTVEVMEPVKADLIKCLLTELKFVADQDHGVYNTNYIGKIVDMLKQAKIDWPELDTIKTGINNILANQKLELRREQELAARNGQREIQARGLRDETI